MPHDSLDPTGAATKMRSVVRVSELRDWQGLDALLLQLGLQRISVSPESEIPGSYWGESEAGLIGNRLYLRADTPLHSVLHEACHFACMDPGRRATLHTDAGGSDTEEHAVCYLQCLLADRLDGYSRQRVFEDMDAWGYHFILGSAHAWFLNDSDDARSWLEVRGLVPFTATRGPAPP